MKVILLNAPEQPVSINRGMRMNSWFDILALGKTLSVDESQIAASTERVTKVIEEEAKQLGGNYEKVFVGGFSQGCCMALNVAILAPFRVGGVVGLSGAAFESLTQKIQDDKEGRFEDKKKNLPLFIYHGLNDPTIMYEHADVTYKKMKDLGFEKMEYHGQKGMGHTVSLQEIRHIKEFLTRMMP